MSVSVVNVKTRRQLRQFVLFPEKLYKDCANWVPPLRGDEFDSFNPKKNGAYDYCECECYLAYKDGKIAGRVAAIVNHRANNLWKEDTVRFGWLDFIEDEEVLKALLDSVKTWGKAKGCDRIKGPLGFTDLDKEGLLVEGYEHLSPFTCLYNYPYYDTLLNKIGFRKDTDWTQRIMHLGPANLSMYDFSDLICERAGIHLYTGKNMLQLRKEIGLKIFHMYNETFAPLYEFTPITDKQIEMYLDTYIPILSTKFVAICVDADNNPVSFAFCVPSLSKVVKKSGGKLFPFGIFRILHALRHNDTLEALMIGILPEYQGKGVIVPMFKYIHENCVKAGIKTMIMNPQLEDNIKVQSLFSQYDCAPFMRRRAYISEI